MKTIKATIGAAAMLAAVMTTEAVTLSTETTVLGNGLPRITLDLVDPEPDITKVHYFLDGKVLGHDDGTHIAERTAPNFQLKWTRYKGGINEQLNTGPHMASALIFRNGEEGEIIEAPFLIGNVPDGGATAAMVGLSFGALALVRRKTH